jgi:uncharacterized Zn finger protein
MDKKNESGMKCDKCSGDMVKSGVLDSGNTKYFNYSCKKCGKTVMKCIGVKS